MTDHEREPARRPAPASPSPLVVSPLVEALVAALREIEARERAAIEQRSRRGDEQE